MTHRAEVLLLDSDNLDIELGAFGSAIEARTACARHEGGALFWSQPWEGLGEAKGRERWYRVFESR